MSFEPRSTSGRFQMMGKDDRPTVVIVVNSLSSLAAKWISSAILPLGSPDSSIAGELPTVLLIFVAVVITTIFLAIIGMILGMSLMLRRHLRGLKSVGNQHGRHRYAPWGDGSLAAHDNQSSVSDGQRSYRVFTEEEERRMSD